MLHKCANPQCSKLFRKMNQGRVFQMPRSFEHESARRPKYAGGGIEYFWLCDHCSLFFTLQFDPICGVMPVAIASQLDTSSITDSHPNLQQPAGIGELQWSA